jgi:HK97 family phage major capsid protein
VLFSPVRDLVGVRQTGQVGAAAEADPDRGGGLGRRRATRIETQNPAYGLVEIPTHELTAEVYISFQDLEDSAFDLEAELTNEFAEQFAVSEGAAVVAATASASRSASPTPDRASPPPAPARREHRVATGAKGDALINLATRSRPRTRCAVAGS